MNRDPYWKLRPPDATSPDELCVCGDASPLILRSVLSCNPIACSVCNREIAPEAISLPADVVEPLASWAAFHDCFYRLWLDSGEFESWARAELSNPVSPVNQRGLALRERLDRFRRTYYWWFEGTAGDFDRALSTCPLCSIALANCGLVGLVCDNRSIVVASQSGSDWPKRG